MNQPQTTTIFTVDPRPEPAWFSFSGWVLSAWPLKAHPLAIPAPLPSPALQLQSLPKAQRTKDTLDSGTADCLDSSRNLLFFDCIEN